MKTISKITGKIILVDKTFKTVVLFTLLEEEKYVWQMIAPCEFSRKLLDALDKGNMVEVEYSVVCSSKLNINYEAIDIIDVADGK